MKINNHDTAAYLGYPGYLTDATGVCVVHNDL